MTAGLMLVATYLAMFYFLPAVGNYLFADRISTIYKVFPLTPAAGLVLVVLAGATVLLHRLRFRPVPTLLRSVLSPAAASIVAVYDRWRLQFAIGALGMGAWFYLSGLNAYRYFSEGISSSGSSLTVLIGALTVVISVDFFRCIFLVTQVSRSWRQRAEDSILAMTLVFVANGTANMLFAFAAVAFVLAPSVLRRLLIVSRHTPAWRRVAQTISTGVVVAVLFLSSWIAGETIKASSRADVTLPMAFREVTDYVVAEQTTEDFFYYLVASMSSHYYALLYTTPDSSDDLMADGAAPGWLPMETLLFRLDYILGQPFEIERPEIGSLSRWNYLLLTNDPNSPRAGTSPGAAASFFYVFGSIVGVLLCAMYLAWIAKLIDELLQLRPPATLSTSGLLLLLLFQLMLFQSPIDMLMIVDNASLNIVLLLCLYLSMSRSATYAPSRPRALEGVPSPTFSTRPLWGTRGTVGNLMGDRRGNA
jgi:hypothetical protein